MHSKRSLLVIAATILSVAALAPSVSASSPRSGELLLTKDCTAYTGQAGDSCTITSSSLNAIMIGSTVVYTEEADFATMSLNTDIVINGPGANTAVGHVTLNLATGVGAVTISGGTGVFSSLHASGVVSPLGGPNFGWTGTYSFSPRD